MKRNSEGLLVGVDYKRNEDNSINWRAMVDDSHFYPNKAVLERRNKPIPSKGIEGLKDDELLIKISGIKELAKLRGFKSLKYIPLSVGPDFVSLSCQINWIENFESEETIFESTADATPYNTFSFMHKFLTTAAENRAFVRCVRNFLNIHIVGWDEMGPDGEEETPKKETGLGLPTQTLMKKVNLGSSDFEAFKSILREWWNENKYRNEKTVEWKDWSDIPVSEVKKMIKIAK